MRNLVKIDKRTLARRFCLTKMSIFAASNFRMMIFDVLVRFYVSLLVANPQGLGAEIDQKFFFHFRLSLGDQNHVHNAINMLGRNDACQQNVVLFELVGEILFDVEALSITYSSLVEPWHVAMSCWRYSSQGPALPEGISSVA